MTFHYYGPGKEWVRVQNPSRGVGSADDSPGDVVRRWMKPRGARATPDLVLGEGETVTAEVYFGSAMSGTPVDLHDGERVDARYAIVLCVADREEAVFAPDLAGACKVLAELGFVWTR